MQNIIISIIGTICFVSLVIYDFLCICMITKNEQIAEKIWKNVFPNKTYNQNRLFRLFRPMFLQVSMLSFILTGAVLANLPLFNLLLICAPPLTLGVIIRNLSHK